MSPTNRKWEYHDWLSDPRWYWLATAWKIIWPIIYMALSWLVFVTILRLGPILWVLFLTLSIYIGQKFKWANQDINCDI